MKQRKRAIMSPFAIADPGILENTVWALIFGWDQKKKINPLKKSHFANKGRLNPDSYHCVFKK